MDTAIEARLSKIEEKLDLLLRQRSGRLITPKQLAEKFGCTPKTIYKLAKERRIPYVRLFSDIRFSETEIDKLIESKTSKLTRS